jgi:plasmid stabilization system protein ParE
MGHQATARLSRLSPTPLRTGSREAGIGRLRTDLKPRYRSLKAGRHIIFYREIADGIEVIRILHEAMDLPDHLAD